jgi:hypothetical protein
MRRFMLLAGFFAAVVGGAGCSRPAQSGGASGSKAEQARKQAEGLAVSVVNGMAKAQAKIEALAKLSKNNDNGWLAKFIVVGSSVASSQVNANPPATSGTGTGQSVQAPPPPSNSPPRLTNRSSSPTIRERVASSLPYATAAEGEEDALTVAQDTIERRLRELDPPVIYRPSINELKNEFLRRDSRTLRAPDPNQLGELAKHDIDTKGLVYVEYEVEVSADQVRGLRTRDRLGDGVRILGVVAAIALAGFLFLRLDQWTRGHLTRWLAIAAVALAGAAAAAMYLV